MLTHRSQNILDNFIITSSKIVVLQALKAAYLTEASAINNPQQTKNFRTAAILEEVRLILEALEEYMEFFAYVEETQYTTLPLDQLKCIQKLMTDMSIYYDWATAEIKLKQFRQDLMLNYKIE